jgi:hypothetical protein
MVSIAAELLTNVAKHAGARHATLEAAHKDGLLSGLGRKFVGGQVQAVGSLR